MSLLLILLGLGLVVGTNHQVFIFFLLFFFSLFFSPLFFLCSLSFPPFSLICLFLFFPPPAPTSSQCYCPGWPWTPGVKQFSGLSLRTVRTSGHHCWSHFFITVLKILLQANGYDLEVTGNLDSIVLVWVQQCFWRINDFGLQLIAHTFREEWQW